MYQRGKRGVTPRQNLFGSVRFGAACRAARRRRGANHAALKTMSLAGVAVGPFASAAVGVSSTALAALGGPECTCAAQRQRTLWINLCKLWIADSLLRHRPTTLWQAVPQ